MNEGSSPMTPDDQELAARRAAVANGQEDYTPVPPKRTFTVNGHYAYLGRGTPLPYGALTAHQATCPNCGQPLPGGTPAQDEPKDVSADRGPAPTMPAPTKQNESWRDRPPLL